MGRSWIRLVLLEWKNRVLTEDLSEERTTRETPRMSRVQCHGSYDLIRRLVE
jgi:hypothetical protein